MNDTLTVKLEGKETNIYVKGDFFRQCKYLLLNIPIDKISSFNEIKSIDEAEESLNHSLDPLIDPNGNIFSINKIPPEVEYWGHCSNLHVWVENNYDSRILHRNLAFPLLKKLADVGDSVAKIVFKDEIAKRIESGFPPVVEFLVLEGYLDYLNDEEFDFIAKSPKVIEALINACYIDEEEQYRFDGLYKFLKILKERNNNYLRELIGNFFEQDNFKLHNFLDRTNLICELSNKELAYKLLTQEEAEAILKLASFMQEGLIFSINPDLAGEPVFVEKKHIIKLNICHSNLKKFPEEILQFKKIKELLLDYNFIPEIPDSICELKELEKLSLARNEIVNLPETICKLKNLRWINVNTNKLVNLPNCIRTMKALKVIYIKNNNIKHIQKSITNQIKIIN